MSDDQQACEVPLVEQLRSIPKDYRTVRAIQWSDDGRETGHQFIPVGHMMHRAADEIERLKASASPGEAVERWVPVSERLPEKQSWNLVCYVDKRMPVGSMSHWFDGEKFRDCLYPVSHWMPLPPSPHVSVQPSDIQQ